MTYRLVITARARRDAQGVFDWLAERSRDGAVRWWTAFEESTNRLLDNPNGYGLAPEDELFEYEVRQYSFRTRRGRRYRGVFVVIGDEIRVLRVRGPGQAPLAADELD